MSSMTITTVVAGAGLPHAAVLHLKLHAANPRSLIEPVRLKIVAQSLQEVLNQLYVVARAHRAWGDHLSLSLHEIIDSILELELYQPEPEEDQVAINSAKIREIKCLIRKLQTEILVEPLYGMELKDPVIEEAGWEWNREVASIFINTCRACGFEPTSPFSERDLESSLREHGFAKAVIAWIDSLPEEYKNSHKEEDPTETAHVSCGAGDSRATDPEDLAEELFTPTDPMSLPPIEAPSAILPSLKSLSDKDRAALQEHFQKSFEQSMKERKKLLQTQYFYFGSRAADIHAARISEGTYVPLEEATADLKEVNEEMKALRAEEELRAQERADREAQVITDQINSLCASHAKHAEVLNARINDALEQLRMTRAELHEARMRIDRNESRIAALENRCRSLEGAVDNLRSQSGGGGCIIM